MCIDRKENLASCKMVALENAKRSFLFINSAECEIRSAAFLTVR